MKHEIRTYAMKDGKAIREIHRESFSTAQEAYKAYQAAIRAHEGLPDKLRKPWMVARFNDGKLMTMQTFE